MLEKWLGAVWESVPGSSVSLTRTSSKGPHRQVTDPTLTHSSHTSMHSAVCPTNTLQPLTCTLTHIFIMHKCVLSFVCLHTGAHLYSHQGQDQSCHPLPRTLYSSPWKPCPQNRHFQVKLGPVTDIPGALVSVPTLISISELAHHPRVAHACTLKWTQNCPSAAG